MGVDASARRQIDRRLRERGGPALDPGRVRQIERLWVLLGVAAMAFAILIQVAIALARGKVGRNKPPPGRRAG
jgi:hypothetical protein